MTLALSKLTSTAVLAAAVALAPGANGQAMYFNSARVAAPDSVSSAAQAPVSAVVPGAVSIEDGAIVEPATIAVDTVFAQADTVAGPIWPLLPDFTDVDSYLAATREMPYDTVVAFRALPRTFFLPAVFTSFEYDRGLNPLSADYSGEPALRWVEEEQAGANAIERISRYLYYEHPEAVAYNINLLPEAPKRYEAVVNPEDHTIEIKELPTAGDVATTVKAAEVRKKHWLNTFTASLQFSQAYVSPNWYQGGNNNLNALGNIYYNTKLNQAYHPTLLFETTMQYKLGVNNAPDDKLHDYNISDDLFQITSTFGVKAARRWYYSVSAMFKTQLLNSYKSNSPDMRAAFMSPGELNVGFGMTYNYTNPKKTIQFDASIAPLSYNLKTCINRNIDPALYEISEGRKTKHKFGSSSELKFSWKICYNISYKSRLFAFTDYSAAYADWENTIDFEINRFLSTQLYVHARYDTSTPRCDDPDWHKLQVKEILSIGFSYKFSSI